MNVAEIVILLIIVAMAVDGVRIGFVKTVFSTVRMIIGVVVAYFVCFYMNSSVPAAFRNSVPVFFLIIIGIVFAILGAVERLLNIVDRIPIAKLANRIAGVAAGLLKGIILVWILFYTVSYFRDTDWGMRLYQMICESDILRFINSYNPIFYGFDGLRIKNEPAGTVFA